MNRHIKSCIRYFENMADEYHKEAEKYEALYKQEGAGSYQFYYWMKARALEDAYRGCAKCLMDENFGK